MSVPAPALAGGRVLAAREPFMAPPGATSGARRARRARRIRLGMLVALGVLAMCVARVWLSLQIVDLGYQLSTLRTMVVGLEEEQRELEIEFATLTSPRRLARKARQRLGLRAPSKGQVVVVR